MEEQAVRVLAIAERLMCRLRATSQRHRTVGQIKDIAVPVKRGE